MTNPGEDAERETPTAIIVKADEVDEAGADISTISQADSSPADFDERIESRRAHDAQAKGDTKILANAVPTSPKRLNRPILRRDGSGTPSLLPPSGPPRDETATSTDPSLVGNSTDSLSVVGNSTDSLSLGGNSTDLLGLGGNSTDSLGLGGNPTDSLSLGGNSTDSLSLVQLKKLITDLPKLERTAYAYEYEDTRAFPEELEEWFQYTEEERYTLLRAKLTFEEQWRQAQSSSVESSERTLDWRDAGVVAQQQFVIHKLRGLASPDISVRVKCLECISHISLGVWGETAGCEAHDREAKTDDGGIRPNDSEYRKSRIQIEWIQAGAELLREAGAVQSLMNILMRYCTDGAEFGAFHDQAMGNGEPVSSKFLPQLEINHILTILYTLVEVGRQEGQQTGETLIRHAFEKAAGDLLHCLILIAAKFRWEESYILPLPRILLLFWKSLLLFFGSSQELKACKDGLRDPTAKADEQHGEGFITTSPLDYHLFRQEITSKYPSYCPPPPLVPIELENNSILPPLPNHPSRRPSHESLHLRAGSSINGGSIFNQPVHIATPAPSPPPSPAGPGGKGGKKQNYQTNQNFPFLYPPLDNTSNTLGGKGSAGLQDQLVAKKWDGSDVPASILEAGQLFASRMRMSRSVRQLWDVREKFIKFERGWNDTEEKKEHTDHIRSAAAAAAADDDDDHKAMENTRYGEHEVPPLKELEDKNLQQRLNRVEAFYRKALPFLQSLVIVLGKVTFANVSAMVSQINGPNGMQSGSPFPDENADPQAKRKSNPNSAIQLNGLANGQHPDYEDGNDMGVEDLNAARSREITSKAVSGIVITLLKWFKLSHILKFEYLTQLLLDANYLPLILKLFAHQDIDRAVDQKIDREDLGFFNFCIINSKHPPPSPPQPALSPSSPSEEEEEEEDSAPPAIPTHRRSPACGTQSPPLPLSPPQPPTRPEVDELGYPTGGALPSSPITNYSPRFFYTYITLLRLLQKITKRKAHRALLLVQYKSSTILRRALKIPQPQLRLYTLKLFKSQVPYCGRKWRQANMRVITAIYLHCKPELRDEWLCGGDVDGVVEEAVPLEQASRSLVHWWHLRRYRDAMEGVARRKEGDDEGNFFERELEKMGWGLNGGVGSRDEDEMGDGIMEGPGGTEWEATQAQLERYA